MSDVKHTPGPWKWDEDFENLMSLDGPVITSAAYENMWFSRYDEEEDTANARLIASAPKLLEALERVLEIASRNEDGPEIYNARAIIAKAKGEVDDSTRHNAKCGEAR